MRKDRSTVANLIRNSRGHDGYTDGETVSGGHPSVASKIESGKEGSKRNREKYKANRQNGFGSGARDDGKGIEGEAPTSSVFGGNKSSEY